VSFRFLSEENIDSNIVQGLRSREPAIDILDVKTAGLRRDSDPDLLDIAAEQGRILITYDRNTITRHNVLNPVAPLVRVGCTPDKE
jgi:predicted nuclease of predicted toxin-antitoxin system